MTSDHTVEPRASGKRQEAATTSWTLTLPDGIIFRSVSIPGTGLYALEIREGKRWQVTHRSPDPTQQLRAVANMSSVAELLADLR